MPGLGISLLVLGIRKTRPGQIRETGKKIIREKLLQNMKFVLFMDEGIDLSRLSDIAWIAANNIDPERDCFTVQDDAGTPFPLLFADATRKTKELDRFDRDWPNIIVMDDETIRHVDKIWNKLGLGPFIASPSLLYKTLVFNRKSTF